MLTEFTFQAFPPPPKKKSLYARQQHVFPLFYFYSKQKTFSSNFETWGDSFCENIEVIWKSFKSSIFFPWKWFSQVFFVNWIKKNHCFKLKLKIGEWFSSWLFVIKYYVDWFALLTYTLLLDVIYVAMTYMFTQVSW